MRCELAIADGRPSGALDDYIAIPAETIQRIHHAIGVHAGGQISDEIAKVTVTMSLDAAPDVPLPTIEFTKDHPIDNTAVEVRIGLALVGLGGTVALSIAPTAGGEAFPASLRHDFTAHPILILTHDQFSAS